MVLGLKPKGKPSAEKNISLGQNLGLAWSSDSSLWGNQVHKRKSISPKQNPGFAKSSDSGFLGNQLLGWRSFSAQILEKVKASVLRRWRNELIIVSLRKLFIGMVTCPRIIISYTLSST